MSRLLDYCLSIDILEDLQILMTGPLYPKKLVISKLWPYLADFLTSEQLRRSSKMPQFFVSLRSLTFKGSTFNVLEFGKNDLFEAMKENEK